MSGTASLKATARAYGPSGPGAPTGPLFGSTAEAKAPAPPRRPQRRGVPPPSLGAARAMPPPQTAAGGEGEVDFLSASRFPSPDAHPAAASPDGCGLPEPPSQAGGAAGWEDPDVCGSEAPSRWPRDVVARTIELWQPYYDEPITEESAREILENTVAFFRIVLRPRRRRSGRETAKGSRLV